jgi:hypothetical protein
MQLVMHLLSLTNLGMEYCTSELFDKAAAPRNDSKIINLLRRDDWHYF